MGEYVTKENSFDILLHKFVYIPRVCVASRANFALLLIHTYGDDSDCISRVIYAQFIFIYILFILCVFECVCA